METLSFLLADGGRRNSERVAVAARTLCERVKAAGYTRCTYISKSLSMHLGKAERPECERGSEGDKPSAY